MKLLYMLNLVMAIILSAATDPSADSAPRANEQSEQGAVARGPNSSAGHAHEPPPAAAAGSTGSVDPQQVTPAADVKKRDHPVHDFSKVSGRDDDTCSACHVPHLQSGAADEADRGVGDLFKIARQRPAALGSSRLPGPTSLICLTCHNGTAATSTVAAAHSISEPAMKGLHTRTALRDHPIGAPYPDRRKGFRPRTIVEAAGVVKLPEGRVECISCHDHHEEKGLPHLLVTSNRRSALCLECHEK